MKNALILIAVLFSYQLIAQAPGTLDNTFDTDGMLTMNFGDGSDKILDVEITLNNKMVCLGSMGTGGNGFVLMGLNEDGSFDASFGDGGFQHLSGLNAEFITHDMALDSEGRILIAGQVGPFQGSDIAVARYLATGLPDESFGTGGFVTFPYSNTDDILRSVAEDAQGRIVCSGETYGGTITDENILVARLNADGSLDTTFGTDGFYERVDPATMEAAVAARINAEDEIFLGCYHFDVVTHGMIMKLDNNGNPDAQFDEDGIAIYTEFENLLYVNDICLTAQNTVLAACAATDSGDASSGVLCVDLSGAPVTSFDGDGFFAHSFTADADIPQSIFAQPDGKVVLAGEAHPNGNGSFYLFRLNPDGSPDNGFGDAGVAYTPFGIYSSAVSLDQSPTGKIVVCGHQLGFGTYDFAVARYHGGIITATDELSSYSYPLTVFPNPSHGATIIVSQAQGPKEYMVVSMSGQQIVRSMFTGHTLYLDTSAWSAGLYCVSVKSQNADSWEQVILVVE